MLPSYLLVFSSFVGVVVGGGGVGDGVVGGGGAGGGAGVVVWWWLLVVLLVLFVLFCLLREEVTLCWLVRRYFKECINVYLVFVWVGWLQASPHCIIVLLSVSCVCFKMDSWLCAVLAPPSVCMYVCNNNNNKNSNKNNTNTNNNTNNNKDNINI